MKKLFLLLLPLLAAPAFAQSVNIPQIPQGMHMVEPVSGTEIPPGMSLGDSIMWQISRCWTLPELHSGKTISATVLNVKMRPDGTAESITPDAKSQEKLKQDTDFRDLTMSAILAVQQCSPLKGLPANDYDKWKDLALIFDPSAMLAEKQKNQPY